MYEDALKEWELTRPRFSESPMSSKRSTKQVVDESKAEESVQEEPEEEAAAEVCPAPGILTSLSASQILALSLARSRSASPAAKPRPGRARQANASPIGKPRQTTQETAPPGLLVYKA